MRVHINRILCLDVIWKILEEMADRNYYFCVPKKKIGSMMLRHGSGSEQSTGAGVIWDRRSGGISETEL
mgnify:CR=1 FL=1